MKYTKIPVNTFEELQLNAGVLLTQFDPAAAEVLDEHILGATTGGLSFEDTPEFSDYGEDIDNCPKNMLELKKLVSREVKMSGTFITMNAETAARMAGAATIDPNDPTHIIPRNDLALTDFADIWWVGDYSAVNDDTNGGHLAIRLINALSTGGFKLQSADKAKGQFAFEFTGHYSMNAQDTVPYELYIAAGTEAENGEGDEVVEEG